MRAVGYRECLPISESGALLDVDLAMHLSTPTNAFSKIGRHLFCVAAISLFQSTAGFAQTVAGRNAVEVVVEKDIMVTMRDGAQMATDIYRPEGAQSPLPVILIRLPYNKDQYGGATRPARFFASYGYIVVVQDTRGKFKSEGEYRIYNGDVDDWWDAIDWVSNQPWSTGRVGSYGCSYLGEGQIIAAAGRHPAHLAAIPQAAGGIVGTAGGRHTYFGFFEGGAIALSAGYGWLPIVAGPSRGFGARPEVDIATHLRTLPTRDMLERVGLPSRDWDQFFTLPLDDPNWSEIGYTTDEDRFDIPALHVNSWYDLGVGETMLLVELMSRNSESERGRTGQYAIISPTSHCLSERATEHTIVGARDYGDARLDYFRIYLDWFDFWLKDIENDVLEMPRVQAYVMGRNEWEGFQQWPPAGTSFERLYLHSGGRANQPDGDGLLLWEPPAGQQPEDRYSYDPDDPVPSRGGSVCCTGNPNDQPGSFDQSDLGDREDVLVYTSAELTEPLLVAGPIEAVLQVSSSALDTDFTIKLLDVGPDGRSWNIQEAILRARYRDGFEQPVFMDQDTVYEIRIDLHATAYEFQPGHRIQIHVSSSNFPRFDRNLNTGGNNYDETEWEVANNALHHSAQRQSFVLLPLSRR